MTTFWLRMGVRNLRKNGRRSLFVLLTIALGYAGINLFSAFVRYIFTTLEDGFVYAYGHGHLMILAGATPPATPFIPMDRVFDPSELQTIAAVCREHPEVLFQTPMLQLSGVLNTAESSAIFWAAGVVPEDMEHIRAQARTKVRDLEFFMGKRMDTETSPSGIAISGGLASRMNLQAGDPVILLGTTRSGQLNAVDAEIRQQMNMFELLSEMFLYVPLPLARELLDTNGADRVVLLVRNQEEVDRIRLQLREQLDAAGLQSFQVWTWKEMLSSYYRTRRMMRFVFHFLFGVIFPIVGINVMNMVGLTVIERTREIGTLRALGLKRRDVRRLFAGECLILGVAGVLLGAGLCVGTQGLIRLFAVEWDPPFVSHRLPLELMLDPLAMLSSLFLFLFLVLISAWIPSNRAAQKRIIDALGHV